PRPEVETPEEQASRFARERAEDAAWLRANPGEKYPPLRYNRRGVEDRRRLDEWEASLPKCIGNVLKELNRTRYAHDAHGNLVRRIEPDGTTWLYGYDAANRLIEAKRYAKPPEADELARREPVAGGGTRFVDGSVRPLLEVSFAYDAFGRRTKKKVMRPDGGIERTFFTWDGDVLLMEERFGLPVKHEHVYRGLEFRRAQIVCEEPQDVYSLPVAQRMHTLERHHEWQAASLYLHEPGSFVPLARLDEKLVEPAFLATGTDGRFVQVAARTRHGTYFYQNDHLGTPQEMVDESGKVVWLARYKAWGGVKRAPYGNVDPVGADNRIRFQGQYHDEETGLAYNRHRYYDAQAGRFISKDPIGLAGGVNVYQYADNPTGWIDPLGLAKRGPKTGGCGPHNEMIAAWGKDVKAAGGDVIAGGGQQEALVKTPGGFKSGRRPDIIYTDADGNTVYGNVGKVRADGVTPVTREQQAMDDLRTKTQGSDAPDDVQFRAYNCCPCKGK
ncbi:RHS repeat domain-containing protein, partial [Paraburkholderia antibiotica]